MKLGEILQRVQSLYSSRVQDKGNVLSYRHIYSKMITVRSTLISQKSKQKQKIGDWSYQTISCIEMIDVKPHECPCAPYPGCETIKRSKYKIPKIMSNYNGNLIDYIMTIDGSQKYDYTNKSELLHTKGNRYTSNSNKYLIDKDYLFIYGKSSPKVIQMRALIEDPLEIVNFISLCPQQEDEKCIDIFEMEFPIDNSSIDTFVQLAVQELMLFSDQGYRRRHRNTNEENQEQQ